MHIEAETTVARPRPEVFDYISRGECLPEYVTDFAWVRQSSEGGPAQGTVYSYKMSRGAEGTFEWTAFEPYSKLAWHGPPARAGPGPMGPAGGGGLADGEGGRRAKPVWGPKPGGLFGLLPPSWPRGMGQGNAQ